MANRKVDDLDGRTTKDVTTVTFALDGETFEIDLSAQHQARLRRDLKPFTDAARKVKQPVVRRRQRSADEPDPVVVRGWAKEQGIEIKDRGRVPGNVIQLFKDRAAA